MAFWRQWAIGSSRPEDACDQCADSGKAFVGSLVAEALLPDERRHPWTVRAAEHPTDDVSALGGHALSEALRADARNESHLQAAPDVYYIGCLDP